MKGTIAKVMDNKGFGFIKGEDGKEYFFHRSGYNGTFEDLEADYYNGTKSVVTFDVVVSSKGPRAENVTRADY